MNKIDLSICIINWNTKNLLRGCLNSIKKTRHLTYETIIVDNASHDGSLEMLNKEFSECKIIPSKINMGFTKGNNRAIDCAEGEFIIFLNPDTELKSNALFGMMQFLCDNPEYGAVGCKLINTDNSIQYVCARSFPTPFSQFCSLAMLNRVFPKSKFFSSAEMNYWDHNNSREVDCISGACIMARKEIIDKLCGFDENIFMYGEDIDLCFRIKKNGWGIYYLSNEEIIHYSGASSSQQKQTFFSTIMQRESNYLFFKKHFGISKANNYKTAVIIGSFIRIIFILLFLFPLSVVIRRKNIVEMSNYSLKKYISLFLWSIKFKDKTKNNI